MQTDGTSHGNAGHGRLDSFGLAAIAFVAYAMFARDEFYGDGGLYLCSYGMGFRHATNHALIYPSLEFADLLAGVFHISFFRAAEWMCALGTAIGLGFAHAAVRRLGSSRGDAAMFAVAVGCCPCVVLFATVYELMGVFFAFVGLGFYAVGHYVRRPTHGTAALVGAASGASFLAHSTGALLVGVLAGFGAAVVVGRRRGKYEAIRAELPRLVSAIVTSIVVIFASIAILRMFGSAASVVGAVETAAEHVEDERKRATGLLTTLWAEWLLPCFPVSVAWLLVWRRATDRWVQLVFLICLVVYLVVSNLLLQNFIEHGTYMLPLVLPAAWMSVRAIPTSWGRWLLAVGGLAVFTFAIPDATNEDEVARRGAGIRSLASSHAYFIVGDHSDTEAFFVAAPEAEWFCIQLISGLDPEVMVNMEKNITDWIRKMHAEQRPVIITPRCRLVLDGGFNAAKNPSSKIILARIEKEFEFVPMTEPIAGFRLESR
jgi:hypothetical protein